MAVFSDELQISRYAVYEYLIDILLFWNLLYHDIHVTGRNFVKKFNMPRGIYKLFVIRRMLLFNAILRGFFSFYSIKDFLTINKKTRVCGCSFIFKIIINITFSFLLCTVSIDNPLLIFNNWVSHTR